MLVHCNNEKLKQYGLIFKNIFLQYTLTVYSQFCSQVRLLRRENATPSAIGLRPSRRHPP